MSTTAPSLRQDAGRAPGRRPAEPRTRELRWSLIRDEPREGATNMALDHALAACLEDGEAVARLYGWSRPTVSFGKNEPARPTDGPHPRPGTALGYVRRPTGGRAVLHDRELTYAIVAPLNAFGGLREAYRRINEALASALESLGASVKLAGIGDAAGGHPAAGRMPSPDSGPCFESAAPGEIVAAGRKLVGSAQARLEGVLLQHGSVLVGGGRGPLARGSITLAELVGELAVDEVAEATAIALVRNFGGAWTERMYQLHEIDAARRLEAERYGRDSWTWRR